MKKNNILLIGTHNKGKFREISKLLSKKIKKISPKSLMIKAPKETGKTFKSNSELKANFFYEKSKGIRIITYIEDSTDERLKNYTPFNSDYFLSYLHVNENEIYSIYAERNGKMLSAQWQACLEYSAIEKLPNCKRPLHVIAFDQDMQTPPAKCKLVSEAAAEGYFHLLKGLGHCSIFRHKPEVVSDKIRKIISFHKE